MISQTSCIEFIGGPLDGQFSLGSRKPQKVFEHMHGGTRFIYHLAVFSDPFLPENVFAYYIVENFHGQLIIDRHEEIV